MELRCIVSVIVGAVLFAVQTHAVIWEADMPSLLKQCYEEHTRDLTSDVPGHDIHTYCLGKFIWQIPNVQGKFNMTENEINHIKSAYLEYQQKVHSTRRHKRQAQRALRRELRVLSDEERLRFFVALYRLKENGVRLQCISIFVNLKTSGFFKFCVHFCLECFRIIYSFTTLGPNSTVFPLFLLRDMVVQIFWAFIESIYFCKDYYDR